MTNEENLINNSTVVEEISDSEGEDSCCNHGDSCSHSAHDSGTNNQSGRAISRNEMKARKLIAKLGLVPVTGIYRVTIKRSSNIIFAINQPDVYKLPNSNSYVVFGEARFEDLNSHWRNAAAANQISPERMAEIQAVANNMTAANMPKRAVVDTIKSEISRGDSVTGEKSSIESVEGEQEEEVELSDIDAKDIETVMKQANVSRAKAIRAMKDNDNDIVNAIMSLSM